MIISQPLQRFVDDELARAPGLIEQVLVAVLEQLRGARAGDGLSSHELHLRRETAQALHERGRRFTTRYVDALRALVQADLAADQRPANARAAAAGGGADPGSEGLALMDEALVESDIEISRAAMLIDSAVEWEQRELQTFTSALRGEAHVGTDSNPLRPALVARALWEATDVLAVTASQRIQVLRTAAAAIASPLKQAYAAACSRIEAQGVEPSPYRTVLLAPGSVAHAGSRDVEVASHAASQPGALHRLLASMPGADADPAGAQATSGMADVEQALARLDALTLRVGPATAASTHADGEQAPPGIDQRLIELLARLFDAMLADPALPAPARGAIARLHVSALRMALRDPALLETQQHPTWRLMDRIASACRQAAAAGPARLSSLALACESLADELARHSAPDATLYRQGLAKLEAVIADDLRQAQQAQRGAIAALQRTDRRMRIQNQVQARMEEQFVRCPVGPAVRSFLLGPWAQLLAETILHSGPEAQAATALTRTVDDLLWSLHPPAHPASRHRLVKLLPGLVARLRAGLTRCGLTASERQAVLDELEAAHTATLWPGGRSAAAANPDPPESPEEIIRRLREEDIDDSAPRRDFGDSVLDLSSLETVPAELLADEARPDGSDERAERAVRAADAVAGLAPGRAVRLLLQGHWLEAQLVWRSEGGELLLFADGSGRTHALTRRALQRLYAEGLAEILPADSLIQRAVETLMSALARS